MLYMLRRGRKYCRWVMGSEGGGSLILIGGYRSRALGWKFGCRSDKVNRSL